MNFHASDKNRYFPEKKPSKTVFFLDKINKYIFIGKINKIDKINKNTHTHTHTHKLCFINILYDF